MIHTTTIVWWAVAFYTAMKAFSGKRPPMSPRCIKCDNLPISGQCTNFSLSFIWHKCEP